MRAGRLPGCRVRKQYPLFEVIRPARLVWTGLLELAGLVPDDELGDDGLTVGSEALRDTPRLAAAMGRNARER